MSKFIAKLKEKPLKTLYFAQFLSAFVDCMILLISQAIITRDGYPSYYLPFVQVTFIIMFVVLSPWVGRFADNKPKAVVLMIANMIKTVGLALFALRFDPAISYSIVGIGAVLYNPGKFGILPFLTNSEDELLKANAKLESYSIIAILAGTIAGGYFSDISIHLAIIAGLVLYGLSIAVNMLLPKDAGDKSIRYSNAIPDFIGDVASLFKNRKISFSVIGTSAFWMSSAVLKIAIFTWVPLTLGITSNAEIGLIFGLTGIGIAIGAAITPFVITLKSYKKTLWFGLLMGLCVLLTTVINTLPLTIILMLLLGTFGGIYLVPMNTYLQKVGHKSIGVGKALAAQSFLENIFMCTGVGAYTLATKANVHVNTALATTGFTMLCIIGFLFIFSGVYKKIFFQKVGRAAV